MVRGRVTLIFAGHGNIELQSIEIAIGSYVLQRTNFLLMIVVDCVRARYGTHTRPAEAFLHHECLNTTQNILIANFIRSINSQYIGAK